MTIYFIPPYLPHARGRNLPPIISCSQLWQNIIVTRLSSYYIPVYDWYIWWLSPILITTVPGEKWVTMKVSDLNCPGTGGKYWVKMDLKSVIFTHCSPLCHHPLS
jgi:hypothetical protein